MKNEYLTVLLVLVVLGGSIIYVFLWLFYRSRKREKRAASLKEFGPQVQFYWFPNEDLIAKFKQSTGVMRFGCGNDVSGCFFGSGAMNLMEGNIGSIDFVTYDYEYSEGGGAGGGSSRTHRGTAILLQSDQLALPSFGLALGAAVGVGRLFISVPKKFHPKMPLKAKEEAGFKQCPTCDSWDVRGGTTDEYGGTGDWCDHCKKSLYKMNEEKALKLLSKASTDLRGWSILASNTQLLLYREQVTVAAEKYQEFMEEALNIFQMFQLGLSDRSY